MTAPRERTPMPNEDPELIRCDSNSYYALLDKRREEKWQGGVQVEGPWNISAVHWLGLGKIRIGPQGEGQPDQSGIVTSNPEDIEWFAGRLMELADELRQVQSGSLTVQEIAARPRK